jgi:membrane fusion protein
MSLPLFRTEVLQAQRQRWLGDVVLQQPPLLRALAAGALIALLLLAVLLAAGSYTRRTRVPGQLVPDQGITTVAAPQASVVVRLPVAEGDGVRRQQALLLLQAPHATRADGDSAASLERNIALRRQRVAEGYAAQQRQLASQARGLARQRGLLAAERVQLDAELLARQRQQAIAEQQLARQALLRQRQFISELQYLQQQSQALELQAAVHALGRQRRASQRLADQIEQQQAEIPDRRRQLDAAQARELATLGEESRSARARGEALVQAPVAGTVGSLLVSVGQPVQAGQPLLSLVPAGSQLQAHLRVPSAAVGFIAPGDAVLLRYSAFPYQRFGHQRGRVLRISRTALASADTAAAEPYYRVVVALERQAIRVNGRDQPLRPGLALEADILGERRRLWQWAFDPLQALAARARAGGAPGEG